jgi:hypothetical protein
MVTLKKKYVVGTHVMFYEIEIYKEFINGLINSISNIDNKKNVFVDLCLNLSEHIEKIDIDKMKSKEIEGVFDAGIIKLLDAGISGQNVKVKKVRSDEFYYHTDYRRDLNYNYCKKVDFIIWGETDSFMPKEGLQAIDTLSEYTDSIDEHKYIMCFGDRKLWDASWDPTVHVDYESHVFEDGTDSHLNKKQAKSQLSIEEMNEVNSKVDEFDFHMIPYTKIDGSFLVISSDLIKCGVNIPLCLLYNDDEGFAISYEQLRKGNVKQFICKNLLKVHARRHPNKRMYVLDEDNVHSFANQKGDGFQTFKRLSQENIQRLHGAPGKFHEYSDLKALL